MTISPILVTSANRTGRDYDSMLVVELDDAMSRHSIWALPQNFRPDTIQARKFFLQAGEALLRGCAFAYTPNCRGFALTESHRVARAIASACESWTAAANRLPIRF